MDPWLGIGWLIIIWCFATVSIVVLSVVVSMVS